MSHSTQDFEYLLDIENVVGVEFDHETHTVQVLVSEKIPEDELEHDQIVANATDQRTDVIPLGIPRAEPTSRTETGTHRERHRPIVGGVSEGPGTRNSAGTGGPGLAKVTDPDSDYWANSVDEGDRVRLSNNHVFAGGRRTPGRFGTPIRQPARLDHGTRGDRVGRLVGYVPLEDGVHVDCAARTAHEEDVDRYAGFATSVGTDVLRDETAYDDLKGQTLQKAGRTTGLTESEVIATSATVRVRMSNEEGDTVTFRDQLVTGDMSRGGDSGSAVFDSEGTLVGLLFAGSDSATIHNKITNVEQSLGVEFAPDGDTWNPDPTRHIVTISGGDHSPGSFAFSFAVTPDTNVSVLGPGKSTEIVGDRVNAYVGRWTNRYRISGYVTEASIPDHADVELDGDPVSPSDLPKKSREASETSE